MLSTSRTEWPCMIPVPPKPGGMEYYMALYESELGVGSGREG